MNFSPESVFEAGCQIIAMNFIICWRSHERISFKISRKSFILKPFEFTKFSDLPKEDMTLKKLLTT